MAQDIVIDTSTLLNFLRIDRLDILASLSIYRFIVTDHVRFEVTSHYPLQLSNLERAFRAGHLVETSLADPLELDAFAALQAHGVLGDGECSAIAAAVTRGCRLAIDDKTARNKAAFFHPTVTLLSTVDLMVAAIHGDILSIAEADFIKAEWEANHRYRLKFNSFSEVT